MDLQRLYSYTRKALQDYCMINSNDKIAVGISGGKDSLALLYSLAGLRNFYPLPFQIVALTVDLGYENFDLSGIQHLCEQLNVEYHIINTQISDIVSENRENKSRCSLCARLRKGAFRDAALSYGCNKIAYAHHMDDIIETMLLSLLYEGRFYAFPPVTRFEDSNLTVIRPLMYCPESEINGFLHKYNLPVVKNPCPYDGHTKREYVKKLLVQLNHENPGVKKRLFHAILEGKIEDWNL